MKHGRLAQIFIFFSLLSLLCVQVGAAEVTDSGRCGAEVTWTLSDDGTLTIAGTGEMWDFYDPFSRPPWYKHAAGILSVVVEEGVTSLGRLAFFECPSLATVTLPESLTALGDSCFLRCAGLEKVNLPDGVTQIPQSAFFGCSGLKELALPAGLTALGYECFAHCSGLEKINLPDGVTQIPERAFYSCSSLKRIDLPKGLTALGAECFQGTGLEEVILPDGITRIPDSAFARCDALSGVTLPDGLQTIGDMAFYCAGMDAESFSVSLPESLTTIGSSAFSRAAVTSLHIPAGVTQIGDSAFFDCGTLTELTFADGALSIGAWAFYRCGIEALELPAGLVSLGESAFSQCGALLELTIRPGLTAIPTAAFESCGLVWVTLPDGLTTIGSRAFSANNVTFLRVPASLTTVEDAAFAHHVDPIPALYFPDGSEALWSAITVAGDENEGFARAAVQYELGQIASGSCGDTISWVLDMEGTLTVSGSGHIGVIEYYESPYGSHPYLGSYYPWYDWRRMVRTLVVEEGITHVGDRAFWEFSSLTRVEFPSTLRAIGEEACVEWDRLTLLELPEGLELLADDAFLGCDRLVEVVLPASVRHVGRQTFDFCPKLQAILVSPDNPAYMDRDGVLFSADGSTLLCYPAAREGTSYDIPSGTAAIGAGAFRNCALEEITFPPGLTTLDEAAFANCAALTGVELPSSLTRLGERAFGGCQSLAEVLLPDGLLEIGAGAFSYCSALEEIVIPAGVTFIGEDAFAGHPQTALLGRAGSYAQTYAQLYDLPFTAPDTQAEATPQWHTSGLHSGEKLSRPQIAALLSRAEPGTIYEETPTPTAPYASGALTQEALLAGLDWLNSRRLIAGVDPVSLLPVYNRYAQDSALTLRLLGNLTHNPDRPEGMDGSLYYSALYAAQKANLSMGYSALSYAIDGCMADEKASNVSTVGHRRWLINPAMEHVGFGQVGYWYATYAHDQSRVVPAYDFVSWPASGNFPAGQFSPETPWSISLDLDRYPKLNRADITVTLTEQASGQSWVFSGEREYAVSDREYFNVNGSSSGYCGSGPAIIFRPDGVDRYEGLYTVTVEGLTDRNGISVPLSFYVNFFDEEEADPHADSGPITEGLFWERGQDSTLRVTGVSEQSGTLVLAVYRGTEMIALDTADCGGLTPVSLSCPCPDGSQAKLFRLDAALSPLLTPWTQSFEHME